MISRRNYVTITSLMLVLLFLFLFSGAYKDSMNEYDINIYAKTDKQTEKTQGKTPFSVSNTESEGCIAYVGSNLSIKGVTSQWCRYRRRNLIVAKHCTELTLSGSPFIQEMSSSEETGKRMMLMPASATLLRNGSASCA